MKREYIYEECCKIRNVIENASSEGILKEYGIEIYPRGWCGLVSSVLGYWLIELSNNESFEHVSGNIGEKTHAWIEHNNLIIDITADQFGDEIPKVIVEENSDFHKKFVNKSRRQIEIDCIAYEPEIILYSYIREQLLVEKNRRELV